MAGSTTSSVGDLLKEEIESGIINQTNTETPLLDSFKDDTSGQILGKYKVKGIRVNRNRGGYYTAEGGAPPIAGTVEIQRLEIPNRFYHHACQFSKQVLEASKSNEAAFADVMRINMEDVQEGVRMKRNQALWGDGRGILALVDGTASTTTVTCDAPGGIAGTNDGTRFINVGDWVAAVIPGGGLRQTVAYEVNGVPSASTFTTTAAVTWTNNDYIVKCVQTAGTLTIGNTEYAHPPMGMSGICDNSSQVNIYFSKSRTTFPVLNATVITGVGAVGADVLQRAIDVSTKLSGAQINELWCEPGVKRAYLISMQQDRRYTASDLMTPNAGTVAAGGARAYANTGLKFGTIPLYQDHMAPYGELYGWDTRWLKRNPGPTGWVDDDGSVLHLSTTAVDTFDAYFRWYEQYHSEKPATAFKLQGITHDFVAAHVL